MTAVARAIPLASIEPHEAFARLASRSMVCWLDSSLERTSDGRFSILAADPRWAFSARGSEWRLHDSTGHETGGIGPLSQLEQLLGELRCDPAPEQSGLPFFGGAIGWLSYDLGRQFEQVPGNTRNDLDVPDIWLAWFDAAIVWDRVANATWLVETGGSAGQRAGEALRSALCAPASTVSAAESRPIVRVRSDFSRAEYHAGVQDVRAGIARGEYYQLNLVQRFECPVVESPAQTYLRLRALNPAPFSAFVAAEGITVLSSSPERFLEVSPDRSVRTCPIKGTRPRSTDAVEDGARAAELLASDKERAELLMIVDLLRNDLGRVCVPGSVGVKRLHALETFATVHHLVGEVCGKLREDVSLSQLVRAVFPGGSITGAPKVSAMRAIDRLERHRRGIGMGSIGYFSAHGRIDLNVAIRTIVQREGIAYFSVGAGIVWDSDPASEYAETLAKAKALFVALGVEGIET